ncbi:MAG: hypothetical protein ACYCTI_01325 [Acidimicrobiales bacterium]
MAISAATVPLRRALSAFCVVLCGAVAAGAWESTPLRACLAGMFCLLVPGAAVVQLLPPLERATFVALPVPLSVAICGLAGLGMYEGAFWHPAGVGLALVALSGSLHLIWLVGSWRGPRPHPAASFAGLRRLVGDPVSTVGLIAGGTLIGTGLWAAAPANPGKFGLFTVLPDSWYVGLGCLTAVAAYRVWRSSDLSSGVMALIIALAITPVVIYAEPRFTWTQGQLGPTLLMASSHTFPRAVGIYSGWPTFFAGVGAWFDVAHLTSLETVAKWWPLVVDIAAALLVRALGTSFDLLENQAWFAALLFSLANFVGQDYYSPQSTALLLGLGILVLGRYTGLKSHGLVWLSLVILGLALVTDHPLTPFLIVGATAVLALVGRRYPWGLPVVLGLLSIGWAGYHFSIWRQYLPHQAFGSLLNNAKVPTSTPVFPRSSLLHLANVGWLLAGGTVAVLALARLYEFRRRSEIALALAAASPIALLLFSAYGHEAIFRVGLFALPWTALLAARFGRRRFWNVAIPLAVPVLAAGYLMSTGSADWINTFHPAELALVQRFETSAPADSTLVLLDGNAPIKSTARGAEMTYVDYYPPAWIQGYPALGASYYRKLLRRQGPNRPYFLLIDTSGSRYGQAYGATTPALERAFVDGLWKAGGLAQVARNSDGTLYRIRSHWLLPASA